MISRTELMHNPIHEPLLDGATEELQLERLKIQDARPNHTFHGIPCPVHDRATVLIASSGAMAERNATRVFAS